MGTSVDLGGQEQCLIGQVGMHALMTLHTARLPFFSNTPISPSSLDGGCLLIHPGFVQPRPVERCKLATFFQDGKLRSRTNELFFRPRARDGCCNPAESREAKKENGKTGDFVQPDDFLCGNIRSKADSTAAQERERGGENIQAGCLNWLMICLTMTTRDLIFKVEMRTDTAGWARRPP